MSVVIYSPLFFSLTMNHRYSWQHILKLLTTFPICLSDIKVHFIPSTVPGACYLQSWIALLDHGLIVGCFQSECLKFNTKPFYNDLGTRRKRMDIMLGAFV
jgi:hypothetical protein